MEGRERQGFVGREGAEERKGGKGFSHGRQGTRYEGMVAQKVLARGHAPHC